MDHSGKGAIVTGGSRGIGFAIARELARSGAKVLITGRTESSLVKAADLIGPNCIWETCHVADAEKAQRCVDRAVAEFVSVDYLVNNAGANPQWGPTIDVELGLAQKLVEVNQWAPLLWTRLVWRSCMRDAGGVVVNITSVGGIEPAANVGYYNATKAALGFLTRQLSAELAPRVRVNAVAPGMIDTEMAAEIPGEELDLLRKSIPLGKFGAPDDIASAVSFLLSDRAGWITGQTLAVDGGMLSNRGRTNE